jgi:group I intron endonuclease
MATKIIIPKNIIGKKHYLYLHLKKNDSTPFYVGIGTIQNKSKYARSKSHSGRNLFWKNISNKYGYTIVIFSESNNYTDILNQEQNYISLLGMINSGGCLVNMTKGGEGCLGYKHTEEHKKKLSSIYSGDKNPMYGKTLSEDEKQIRSLRMKGKNNPRYGKVGIDNPRSKKINQIYIFDKSIIATFESIRLAAKSINVSHSSINKAIKNKTKCKNYYWSYVD